MIRTDVAVPDDASTVVILHRDAALLVAPAAGPIHAITDLPGHTVGEVHRGPGNDNLHEALLAQYLEIGGKARDGGLREGRHLRLALVPPVGERSLRIDVDQHHGALTRQVRLHREVTGQGGLARSALLRGHRQHAHVLPSSPLGIRQDACHADR